MMCLSDSASRILGAPKAVPGCLLRNLPAWAARYQSTRQALAEARVPL